MNEYIEREAAISSLNELEKTSYHNSVLWPDHVEECREALRSIPAADVRPVVRGRWIKPTRVPDSMLDECSVCGFDTGAYTFNYCPNCGADMREES